MPIAHTVSAVYEDGWLKPLEPLPLHEHQHVELTVTVPDELRYHADPERLHLLHEEADRWLAQQPAGAVQEPRQLSPQQQARLDAEFDQLIAEIQAMSDADGETLPADLVDEAVAAARKPHG